MAVKMGIIGPETSPVVEVKEIDYASIVAKKQLLQKQLDAIISESNLLDKLVEDSVLTIEETKVKAETAEEEAIRIEAEKAESEQQSLTALENQLAEVKTLTDSKKQMLDENQSVLSALRERIKVAEARKNPEVAAQLAYEKAEADKVQIHNQLISVATNDLASLKNDVEAWIAEFEEFTVNRELVLSKEDKSEEEFIRNHYEKVKDECFSDYFAIIDDADEVMEEEIVKSLAYKTKGACNRFYSLIQSYGEEYLEWDKGQKRRNGRPVRTKATSNNSMSVALVAAGVNNV